MSFSYCRYNLSKNLTDKIQFLIFQKSGYYSIFKQFKCCLPVLLQTSPNGKANSLMQILGKIEHTQYVQFIYFVTMDVLIANVKRIYNDRFTIEHMSCNYFTICALKNYDII